MCLSGNPGSALSYLQTQISIVVNHSDEVESKEFRQLTQHLLFVRTPLLAGQTLSVRPGVGGMVSSDSSTPEGELVGVTPSPHIYVLEINLGTKSCYFYFF